MVDGLMRRRLGEVVPWESAGAAAPVTAAAVTTLDRMSRRDVAPRSGRVGPRGDRASSIMTSPPLIIRVWGVLNTYRPQGHTSWSRALVRHRADARAAIAAVLGVPAEQIGVRGNA